MEQTFETTIEKRDKWYIGWVGAGTPPVCHPWHNRARCPKKKGDKTGKTVFIIHTSSVSMGPTVRLIQKTADRLSKPVNISQELSEGASFIKL